MGCVMAIATLLVGETDASSASAASPIYYVATKGNDANPGTIHAPWKTLQHAADVVEPGSTVFVRGGVYKQTLKITRSGSAKEGPITFASYAEEKAIIDGSGLSVAELQGLVEMEDASYITIKGFEIRNFKTTKKDHVPVGILVHGAGSHIDILNNKVHNIQNTAKPSGSDLLGRDAHGIAVYGTKAPASINNVKIEGNELFKLVLGSSESLVLNGNVDTFSVSNNLVHDNDNLGIVLIGFEGVSPDDAYDQARNGVVSGNKVYNNTSNKNPSYGWSLPNDSNGAGGIYVDGGKDIVIERNYSYKNDIGIEIASEHAGGSASNITVRSNMIYSNRYTGIAMGGYDSDRGSTYDSSVINNTLYMNNTLNDGSGQILLQYDTRNNVIQNNIIVGNKSNVLIYNEYTENEGNVVDYNLYYVADGSDEATWIWKNEEYTGFSDYQNTSGNDAHSIFGDPKFVKASKGDFHLIATSAAIDAGTWNDSLKGSLDIDGQERVKDVTVNMGADE